MAAFELPKDLIRQVQIALRNEARLSSFDPSDPTLPSLPTLEASIASLDPSPPYLRCKHCNGKLLRGVQSLICIYCGKYQKNGLPPEPITFKSTFGYRWLLDSLDLNGSEMVGPLAEGSEFSKRQSTPKEEISLSELLDLKITWPDEPEKPGTIFETKTLEHSKSSVNMTAVDLDNFFSGSKRDTMPDAYVEKPVISKNIESIESKSFVSQEDLSLFQNVLPSETVIVSSIDASADRSSGWEAEFQSVDSRILHEDSKSGDPFVGSSVDLSAHIDSVFGPVEDLNDTKLNNDSTPLPSTVNDWIQDDLFTNINSSVSHPAEQVDSVVKAKDGLPPDNLINASSESFDVDWFQDTKWQGNSASNMTINKDDDPVQVGPTVDAASPISSANDLIQHEHNVRTPVTQQAEQFDFTVKNKSGLSADNLSKPSSESVDWFQDNQWQTIVASTDNMTSNRDDESFDDWNDFTGSTVDQDSSQHSWKQGGNEIAAASEQMSELCLFPPTSNSQEVDLGSFVHSDFLSGSSSNYNNYGTQGVNNSLSEVSTPKRDADAKVGSSSEQPEKDGDVSNPTKPPKGDAEMLMSQLHDLSFMLESNLSIPSKPDSTGFFPQN